MPLASTVVVHPDWAGHTATTVAGTWNASCVVEDGTTGGGWDPTTGATPGTPIVVHAGRCRVTYEPTQPRLGDAADQAITTRVVTVALPRDSVHGLSDAARVRITAVDTNGPTSLIGRVLTVEAAAYTSHAVEQLLTCRDDQSNQPGGA